MISIRQLRLFSCLAALLTCGCNMAFHVKVQSDPLKRPAFVRAGELTVGELKDTRTVGDKGVVGVARNGFGVDVGVLRIKDARLEAVLKELVVNALKEAGYKSASPSDASASSRRHVLEGEIKEFWLDGSGWSIWNQVTLVLRLRERAGGAVVWEREVKGREDTPHSIGIWQSSQQSIREALAIALNAAVVEFTSEEFHSKATAGK